MAESSGNTTTNEIGFEGMSKEQENLHYTGESTGSMPMPSNVNYGPPPVYSEFPIASGSQAAGWNPSIVNSNVVIQQPTSVPPSAVMYVTRDPQQVIINQSAIISNRMLMCRRCRMLVPTKVTFKPGPRTHIWACCLCLFGCWFCAPLPYCTPTCMTECHTCINCGAKIAELT